MYVHLTKKSNNAKTGPIPVSTTSQETCPDTCPFNTNNAGGCYAGSGPLKLHWDKVTSGERGMNWFDFCDEIEKLPNNQLWRHNQAGDLPHKNGRIYPLRLGALVKANKGKKGFTYTHHDPNKGANKYLIENSNKNGFTINLSANNPDHADEMVAMNIAPVVTLLPSDTTEKTLETKKGNKIVVCPATYRNDISCSTCGLCAQQRNVIVGFPAHGTSKKKAEQALNKG